MVELAYGVPLASLGIELVFGVQNPDLEKVEKPMSMRRQALAEFESGEKLADNVANRKISLGGREYVDAIYQAG